MPMRWLAAPLAWLFIWVGSAGAGTIRGQLWLDPPTQSGAAKSSKGRPPVQRGITDAVVYVETVPDPVERRLARRRWFSRKPRVPRVIQADHRIVPRVLAVAAGTRVEFENFDRIYHNLFSVSAARRFDLGKYAPGHRDTVAFDRAGVANLHCDIHPDEIAYVVVVANHCYARPDSLGRFRLPKLPAGSYTVHVWHPHQGEVTREVEMPHRGDLALDLRF
jgi:hypothetical protein